MLPFLIKDDDITSRTNAQIHDRRFRAFQVSMGQGLMASKRFRFTELEIRSALTVMGGGSKTR